MRWKQTSSCLDVQRSENFEKDKKSVKSQKIGRFHVISRVFHVLAAKWPIFAYFPSTSGQSSVIPNFPNTVVSVFGEKSWFLSFCRYFCERIRTKMIFFYYCLFLLFIICVYYFCYYYCGLLLLLLLFIIIFYILY